jgi:hypothetical protein
LQCTHYMLQRPSPLPCRRSRRVASLQHGLINWSVARCGGSRLGSVAAQYRQCVAARGRLHRVATCSVATAPLVVLFCNRCGSHRSPPRRTRGSTRASQRSCASLRRVRAAESPLRRIASHRIASHRIASLGRVSLSHIECDATSRAACCMLGCSVLHARCCASQARRWTSK